jgi:hypothetical protein
MERNISLKIITSSHYHVLIFNPEFENLVLKLISEPIVFILII